MDTFYNITWELHIKSSYVIDIILDWLRARNLDLILYIMYP